jgi:LysM repeat protein
MSKSPYPGYLRRKSKHTFLPRLFFLAMFLGILVLVMVAQLSARTHKVRENETLYSLGQQFGVSVEQIQVANNLIDNHIKIGQTLIIPEGFYIVAEGDTLAGIAQKMGVNSRKLYEINQLNENSPLKVGQQLVLPQDVMLYQVHKVEIGQTLSYISLLYDISQEDLILYNDLESKTLKVGQSLALTPNRPRIHVVLIGETLYSLARRYSLSVDQLMQYNALNTDKIVAGQKLYLYNPSLNEFSFAESVQLIPDLSAILEPINELVPEPLVEIDKIRLAYAQPTQLYFSRKPRFSAQPSVNYAEPQPESYQQDYREAVVLMTKFEADVMQLPPLSNALEGYNIVLDPGHGGLDPGALATVIIDEQTLFMVEDEYVYDIALRLYTLLKRHGAEVMLTILVPNHTIRDNEWLESFVNQKNEVYNDVDAVRRPVGGPEGLKHRVEIARKFYNKSDESKRIFMSLHADAEITAAQGLVLTEVNASANSKRLGDYVIETMGRGRQVEGEYIVLVDNPATAAVLVEVRSLGQVEAALLLDPTQRQADAEKLAQAILAYASD